MSLGSFIVTCALCSLVLSQQQPSAPYTLVVQRQSASSRSTVDLITLRCRNADSEDLNVQDVLFWFNRVSPDDPGIENEPYVLLADDGRGIVFQLPRQREGNYTCGVRIDAANVMESERETLIGELTSELHD